MLRILPHFVLIILGIMAAGTMAAAILSVFFPGADAAAAAGLFGLASPSDQLEGGPG